MQIGGLSKLNRGDYRPNASLPYMLAVRKLMNRQGRVDCREIVGAGCNPLTFEQLEC